MTKYYYAIPITPSDNTPIASPIDGLYVGTAGNVAVIMARSVGEVAPLQSGNVLFVAVQAGSILPIKATQVLATGTTANNIIGLR